MMMPIFGVGAAGGDDPVDLVGGEPGDDRGALVFLQALFLLQDAVGAADVEAARRQRKVRRRRPARRGRAKRRPRRSNSIVSLMHLRPTQTPA